MLSVPSKVYAKILDSGRSCVNQILTIRQLSEKILEKNKHMIIVCVDLEKAYDKVCREKIWRILVRYKVDGQLQ